VTAISLDVQDYGSESEKREVVGYRYEDLKGGLNMKRHVMAKVLAVTALSAVMIGLSAGCCCWSGVPSWSIPAWPAGMVRGSGNVIQEKRDVGNFDKVATTSSGDVVITQTGEESLIVETDDNIMQYVETEVRGKTLYLGIKPGAANPSPTRLRFTVTADELAGLETSSSGDIDSGSIETDYLDVKVSSSGDISIDSLDAWALAVKISSSGSVEVSGEVSEQDVTISSSGEYRAGDLRSETTEMTISSSGDATVWVTESLDVRLSSSGSVNYYGNPRTDVSATSSGKAKSMGEK
jgi:hypothetical protein